ncbi:hypothetical protein ABPG74_020969 [Tetrahymena malaccensis]
MAKRTKPLTLEQKREKMLHVFHETQQVYNLKEIEKFSTKAGIVLPTVKDVLMSLIADGLVDSDKIGSANFYWSLPSQTYSILKIRLAEAEQKMKDCDQKKVELEDELEKSVIDKEPSDDRTEQLNKLKELQETLKKKEKDLEKYKKYDPERLKQLEEQTEELKTKVNLWTDNLFSLKSYIQKLTPMDDEEVEKAFSIPADLDNV